MIAQTMLYMEYMICSFVDSEFVFALLENCAAKDIFNFITATHADDKLHFI